MKRLSLTTWSMLALGAGLGLGILGHKTAAPVFERFAEVTKAVGGLWVSALQLTVLPLIITQLLAAISSVGAKSVGKLGIRAVVLFVGMLIASGMFAALLAPSLVAHLRVDPSTVESFSTATSSTNAVRAAANEPPDSIAEWIGRLLPTNLLEAGMRGDILPLLLFTAVFAIAVTRLPKPKHELLTSVFQGIAEAMLQLTRWVLVLTPVGVFALTYLFALKSGGSTGGVLGAYILIVSGLMLLFTALLYPLSALVGRVKIADFARGVFPAQIVAVSTRSSIAALPALVDGGRHRLHLPSQATSFLLPLSVSLFKVNRPMSTMVKLVLMAHIYGVTLRPTSIALFLATIILISFGTAGIPQSGPGFKSLPAYLAAGVPIEGIIVLEAVEAIPDIFKTVLNVTGDMSAATLLTRSHRSSQSEADAEESSTAAEGAV